MHYCRSPPEYVGPGRVCRGGEMQLDSVHMSGRTLKLANGLDGWNLKRGLT